MTHSAEDERRERALLRAEIEELVVENAYLLDRGRFREILELYTDDCEVSRPAPPFTGPQNQIIRGRAALAEWYASPAAWPATPRTMRHVVTNLRVTRLADDRAAATLTWTGYRYEGAGVSLAVPMAVGDYEDEYRKGGDGRWRIHRRKVTIAFLNEQLLAASVRETGAAQPILPRRRTMAEKFELASKAWLEELFRLFREAAREHPEITFSLCEVFTKVPPRLEPDAQGKLAWHGIIRDGRAELAMGEKAEDEVDLKTIAEWEAVLPAARTKIDLADPQAFLRYQAEADKLVADGRIRRFGDRSKVPLVFVGIHNSLADLTQ
ncbi:MAG: nuclear transport factor 2 family protein [Candidatus Binatia bacterium]